MRNELEALAAELGRRLAAGGLMLVTAESCTGGWIAKCVTDVAGSSGWLDRGFVTYSNAAKVQMLGVEPQTLVAHGAVSEPVARAMVLGALRRSDAQVGVAVSGVAGPGGGSAEKPVGTVCFGYSVGVPAEARVEVETLRFDGDRDAVRRQSVAHALRRLTLMLADAH